MTTHKILHLQEARPFRPCTIHIADGRKIQEHRTGLARGLSKLGFCSRSAAWKIIQDGRVRVNARIVRDPETRVDWQRDRIEVDDHAVRGATKVYLMLNKPRGLVTTASDEHGRETVYACLAGSNLPPVMPVGRLDKASEGLLLLTNDTRWSARITDPATHLEKTYHIQINCIADEQLLSRMMRGVQCDSDFLAVKRARILRQGERNSWVEVILDEGKNRHIRRLLAAFGIGVLRLVRVAIGPLQLGSLAKSAFRSLTDGEVLTLTRRTRTLR